MRFEAYQKCYPNQYMSTLILSMLLEVLGEKGGGTEKRWIDIYFFMRENSVASKTAWK